MSEDEPIDVPGDIRLAFVRKFGVPGEKLTDEQDEWLTAQLKERGLL